MALPMSRRVRGRHRRDDPTPSRLSAAARHHLPDWKDRLAVEALERRVLLASPLLGGMAQAAADQVDLIRQQIGTALENETLGQIPVIGPQAARAADFLDTLADQIIQQIDALADDAVAGQVEDALNGIDGVSNADVTLATDSVSVSMDLSAAVTLAELELSFDIGLRALPVYVHSTGGLEGSLEFSYENFAFTYEDPEGAPPPVFSLDTTNDVVSIAATAGLSEDAAIEATLGFIHGSVSDAAAPGLDTGVSATLSLDVTGAGVTVSSATGQAAVALDLVAELTGPFPDVKATFLLDWPDLQQAPEASFQDVRITLGDAIGSALGPVVNALEPIFDTLEPITNVLTEPLPVLDELGLDVNLIGLAEGVLNLAGDAIPANYKAYIETAILVVQITDVLAMFEGVGEDAKNIEVNFGSFDIAGGGGVTDLRLADPANDILSDELSSLLVGDVGIPFDIEQFQQTITDNLPPGIAGPINEALDRFNQGVNFSFPLLTDPQTAIFPLLLGRDVDLATFSVFYETPGDDEFSFLAPFPLGIDGGFDVAVEAGVDLEVGLDTFGLRSFIASDFEDPLSLRNGLYIRDGSNLFVGGELTAFVSAGVPFFGVALEGGLEADFMLEARKPDNPADEIDNNPDRVRLFEELGGCLMYGTGGARLFLDFLIKIGVSLPVIGFVGYEKDFSIAEKTLFDIGGCLIDPFNPPEVVLAEYDDVTGVLTLNMGPQARRDARGFEVDEIDENFVVARDGDQITVTAFGITQMYPLATRIVADGDSGADLIRIAEGLDVEAELTGGDEADRLEYLASGAGSAATLNGDAGDDFLLSHAMSTHLLGGADNDSLLGLGGGLVNLLEGGDGDDRLTGGAAGGQLFGGAGADQLTAGDGGDFLSGGGQDDLISFGAGNDTALGGAGDDSFNWEAGDGSPVADGEGGADSLNFLGTDGNDAFELVINFGVAAIGVAPSGLPAAIAQSIRVERLSVDGLLGADTATVTPTTAVPQVPGAGAVSTVLVNSADIQNPDAAEDTVLVRGQTNEGGQSGVDAVTVEQFDVTIVDLSDENDIPREPNDPTRAALMRIARIMSYEVITSNVADALTVNTRGGNDGIRVHSVTGPTTVTGGAGDDQVLVRAIFAQTGNTLGDYPTEVDVFDSNGTNTLRVDLSGAGLGGPGNIVETLVTDSRVFSFVIPEIGDEVLLLPGVNYNPGSVTGGLAVLGSLGRDTLNVSSTLPNVVTEILGNDGNDDINLSSTFELPGGNLSQIRGLVRVDGGAGASNVLALVDVTAAGGNANVVIAANTVSGFAGPVDNTPVNFFASNGGQIRVRLEGSDSPGVTENYTVNLPGAGGGVQISDNAGNSNTFIHRTGAIAGVTVAGGAGNDNIVIAALTQTLNDITAPIQILGGDGAGDAALVVDLAAPAASNYQLDDGLLSRNFAQIGFDGTLETLLVGTSQLADVFNILALPENTNVLVDQNGGVDALIAPNTENTWRLLAAGGLLNDRLLFLNGETFIGGNLADEFFIHLGGPGGGGSAVNLFGGAGPAIDVLDYSVNSAAVTFNFSAATPTANNIGGFTGFERVIGSSSAGDAILGAGTANTFDIQGTDAGLLSNAAIGQIDFSSVERLVGGGANDLFRFFEDGALTGGINGGGGANTLDYGPSLTSVTVDLQAGSATRIGLIANIRHVAGGGGDDLIAGDGLANIIFGNGGHDILLGRDGGDILAGLDGRDILIGGAGGDWLFGGNDDDLLIAGSTAHDNSAPALLLLRAEWTRADADYAQRINHLRNGGAGALNGAILLNANTVIDDGVADLVFGGPGDDWFWATTPPDALPDRLPGEELN